jgi:hypothetical protein
MHTAEAVAFPFHRFAGTHRQIGEQFGEAASDRIRRHRDLALARLQSRSRIAPGVALAAAMRYRPYVQEHAAFLDEEIQGVAAGAGISLEEAYLLQLRAELAKPPATRPAGETGDECTTFAVLADATANGVPLVGQNADLPAFYGEISIVMEVVPDDMPSVLMLTPAGQVSYIGINDQGVGVFANFLTCDGWRVGFPRYFFSRLALTHDSVDAAIAAIRALPRASSRNMIMLDSKGTAADLETTPTRDARLDPVDGLLTHANHYVADALLDEERSPANQVANSRVRQARMSELLSEKRGQLDAAVMQEILRDRACYPDTLCRQPGDDPSADIITFASVIAEPSLGQMWVAVGPPDAPPNQRYAISHAGEAAPSGSVVARPSMRS